MFIKISLDMVRRDKFKKIIVVSHSKKVKEYADVVINITKGHLVEEKDD